MKDTIEGVTSLTNSLEVNDIDSLRKALEAGADVNALGDGGSAELHWACRHGLVDKVRFLLEHGADPNIMSRPDSFTPLHVMIIMGGAREAGGEAGGHYFEIACLLLEHGADITLTDSYGKTILDYAVKFAWTNSYREKYMELFREREPELCFTRFCSQGPQP